MRSIDWSSDVFSSDLASVRLHHRPAPRHYAFLLKVQTDGQIYLPRGPVIGGENAFGTQGRAKARRSVGEDEFARTGILPQAVVARDDIFLVRQVLAVEADRPFVVVGRSEERRVGTVSVSTGRSGWAPSHKKTKNIKT